MRGDRSASNVRLLCKCHNLYIAELDFGKATDRVGEPVPSIELCPGRVEPRPLVEHRASTPYARLDEGAPAHVADGAQVDLLRSSISSAPVFPIRTTALGEILNFFLTS